jgi:hypothetical protein
MGKLRMGKLRMGKLRMGKLRMGKLRMGKLRMAEAAREAQCLPARAARSNAVCVQCYFAASYRLPISSQLSVFHHASR